MNTWIRVLAVSWFLTGVFPGVSGGVIEFGDRPPTQVFDPAESLGAPMTAEISEPLVSIYQNEGVDVVVVVLDDLEGESAREVALRFAERWCDSPAHAVVLHVPGTAEGPWIVPGGELVDQLEAGELAQAVDDARRRASLEPTESRKVRAASVETADMLRYWSARAANRLDFLKSEQSKILQELESESRKGRIRILVGMALAIACIAGLLKWFLSSHRPGPRYFDDPDVVQRLGAPRAGGNRAVVDLGPPPTRKGE